MNRLENQTVIIGKGIELTEEVLLRLETEMVELGQLLEVDILDKTSNGYIVKHGSIETNLREPGQGSMVVDSPTNKPIWEPNVNPYRTGQPSRPVYKTNRQTKYSK